MKELYIPKLSVPKMWKRNQPRNVEYPIFSMKLGNETCAIVHPHEITNVYTLSIYMTEDPFDKAEYERNLKTDDKTIALGKAKEMVIRWVKRMQKRKSKFLLKEFKVKHSQFELSDSLMIYTRQFARRLMFQRTQYIEADTIVSALEKKYSSFYGRAMVYLRQISEMPYDIFHVMIYNPDTHRFEELTRVMIMQIERVVHEQEELND